MENEQLRISVIAPDGTPLMPTKASRAKRWVKAGIIAKEFFNDLGIYCIQLLTEPSGRATQPIVVGIDPGKHYSGIGVQSARATLFMAHLLLPFGTVKEHKANQKMMRRGRRGRRINRQLAFNQRSHRQKRFDNRRQKGIPPSILSNHQLEYRTVLELCQVFPISRIVYEYIKADVDLTSGRKTARSGKGFSPVMVGQKWMVEQLSQLAPTVTIEGWKTANIRQHLNLDKQKVSKGDAVPQTHAVDGVALASHGFVQYRPFHTAHSHGHEWVGEARITTAPFVVIRRPPISRRQLHLMVPVKGGVRRKYGGTTTRHGFNKGDQVRAEMAGRVYIGWVSGDTERQVSVSDFSWKRLGQFTASKVQLLHRATGLLVTRPQYLSLTPASNPAFGRSYPSPTCCARWGFLGDF